MQGVSSVEGTLFIFKNRHRPTKFYKEKHHGEKLLIALPTIIVAMIVDIKKANVLISIHGVMCLRLKHQIKTTSNQ